MKKWSVFGAAVLCGAAFVWLLSSAPASRAEDDMSLKASLASGFRLTKATPVGSQGMPGVRKIVLYRVEVRPGAEWRNLSRPADIWDFCYELAGDMTMTASSGTRTVITPGSSFTFAPKTSIRSFANATKLTAAYLCWEFMSK